MMNLFYLKCFLDAVLMGSISEAARRNFVSQSAVSQAIRKLEETLQVKLSSHKKHVFEPTEEGKIVFKQAEAIFSSVRSLYDALGAYAKNPRTPLHFVTTHSIGLSLLPHFLVYLRQAYPQIEIHFQFGGLSQIKGWLKQGIFEFALVLDGPYLEEYQKFPLLQGTFGLYKNKSMKKSAEEVGIFVEHKEGFLVSEWMHLNPISHTISSEGAQDGASDLFSPGRKHCPSDKESPGEGEDDAPSCAPSPRECEKWGLNPLSIKAELNSWELIARTLEEEGGYGLLPDFVLKGNRYRHLTPLSTPCIPYTLVAIAHKGKELSYSAKTFLKDFLEQVHL